MEKDDGDDTKRKTEIQKGNRQYALSVLYKCLNGNRD